MLLSGIRNHFKLNLNRLLVSVVFASLTLGGLLALVFFTENNLKTETVLASPPKIINYQAKVTDNSGVTVTDGSYGIKFAIYDASSGGSCLYVASGTCGTPSVVTTTITSGVFSILLGDTSADLNTLTTSTLSNPSIYLGVTIGTDSEMTPRKRLVASPYAINSLTLNNMDAQTNGGTSSYIVAANSTGNLTITGSGTSTFSMGATFATGGGLVGIATATPIHTLDVNGDISSSQGIRDGLSWIQNQGGIDKLRLGYNNGGFGGGATPGNLSTTSSDVTVFDAAAIVNDNEEGEVFDGRYVYFMSRHGKILRYDTTGSFMTTTSWEGFNTSTNTNFRGGAFDGRYVYFVPYGSGQVTRYDTTGTFTNLTFWTSFDTVANVDVGSHDFFGAVFDGRYVYLVPSALNTSGQVTRYDTSLPFTTASSWSVFDTTANVNANSKGFFGGVFDGRYIYFVPANVTGQVTRYDTTGSFTTAASWSFFATNPVSSKSQYFAGGVFDGRYVYFIPGYTPSNLPGQITRYDTTASFTATSSYSFFDTTANVDSHSKGFASGVFDGRYVYFIPSYGDAGSGQITKYDTTGAFTASSSWSVYDTAKIDPNSIEFMGAVFDGRYIYMAGELNGYVTRIKAWAGGVDSHPSVNQTATTRDLYLDSQGQVGLGTMLPSARLTVTNGSIDIGTGSATTTVSSTFMAFNKTSTNTSGTFYLDPSGNIFSSGTLTFQGHTSSTITGTGLVFKDTNGGQASSQGFGLILPGGYLCVSSTSTHCVPSGAYASGTIYAELYKSTSMDVAENFLTSDEQLSPGDVVTFDSLSPEHIKKTTEANEKSIAGVVSTKPGMLLGNDDSNAYPLALSGRVPIKVTNENGSINPGDWLVSSSKAGYAMKYVQGNTANQVTLIGTALTALPSDQSEGKVIVFLEHSFINGQEINSINQTNQSTLTITDSTTSTIAYDHDLDLNNHSLLNVQAISGNIHWSITADGALHAERIETKSLQTEQLTITSNSDEHKTAGRGIIPSGSQSMVVENASLTNESEIFVTFDNDPGSGYFITDKMINQSFILHLRVATDHDVSFAYWLVVIHEDTPTVVHPVGDTSNTISNSTTSESVIIPADTTETAPTTTVQETSPVDSSSSSSSSSPSSAQDSVTSSDTTTDTPTTTTESILPTDTSGSTVTEETTTTTEIPAGDESAP